MLLNRAVPAAICALLVLPVLPGGTALAAETGAPVEVTAVVQQADGRVSFVTERAASVRGGRDLARRMRARAGVVAADVAKPVRALATADPLRGQQWGLTRLAAEQVWASGPAAGQVVAVLDTGVDAAHPDLSAVVLPGHDLLTGGTGMTDAHGHGTHVAGIVAASADNGVGGAGLAQGAKILPVRVLDATGSGTDGKVAKGLVWAVDHGATVANLSLGGDSASSVLTAAVDYALSKGVVVVAAAGNAGANGDPVLYPAATPGVVAVGAVRSDDVRPAWSSTGQHLAVAAPGAAILSTVPGGGHASWSGTSMAAPFVAAAAAIVRSTEPGLTAAAVRERLMATAHDLGVPGHDALYGAGMIDVVAARAPGLPAPAPAPVESSPATEPAPSDPVVTSEPAPAPAPVEPAPAPAPVQPAPAPAPVQPAPAPAPVQPAPAPAPVQPAPAPAPVEPAPVQPAPAPVAPPAPPAVEAAPVVPPAPVPAPVEPAPVVAPAPVAPPAPPVLSGRTSRSAAVIALRAPVALAARILADGRGADGHRVILERRVGSGPWTVLRSGTTSPDGLVSWVLQPDVTGEHRFRSGSWTSAPVPVQVRQTVVSAARRSGGTVVVTARVAPGGRTPVALQIPRGAGWATIATATTDTAGAVRFVRALRPGTAVRVYSPARPHLLAVVGSALRP